MEESVSAAENAWSGGGDDFSCVGGVCDAEHTIMDLGFNGCWIRKKDSCNKEGEGQLTGDCGEMVFRFLEGGISGGEW
ncbi:hypothetical protein OIU77_000888 [Salix suchowensis]|uniref:Uncharacterized protein n=1 Tax=Salix suchowensis TaxID=1278906 RepID=A0ABQ9BA33_9ROSI|nr:hypothetical protein OIU77_000888 [Salix suchowensis]